MSQNRAVKPLFIALTCLAVLVSLVLPGTAEAKLTVSDVTPQLSASVNGTQVSLQASVAEKVPVSGYQLERSLEPTSGYSVVSTSNKGSFADRNVEPGKAYYYRVRAYKNGKTTEYSRYSDVEFADIEPENPPEPEDTTPPSVSLTSPPDKAVYESEQTVTISADATDDTGVERVDFYRNDVLVGSDTTPPYSYG